MEKPAWDNEDQRSEKADAAHWKGLRLAKMGKVAQHQMARNKRSAREKMCASQAPESPPHTHTHILWSSGGGGIHVSFQVVRTLCLNFCERTARWRGCVAHNRGVHTVRSRGVHGTQLVSIDRRVRQVDQFSNEDLPNNSYCHHPNQKIRLTSCAWH